MKTKKKPTIETYGNVGVDSGPLLIIAPSYLEMFMKKYSYDDICSIEGNMQFPKGHDGIACKLGGFGGDGMFDIDSVTFYNKYSPPYSKFILNLYE